MEATWKGPNTQQANSREVGVEGLKDIQVKTKNTNQNKKRGNTGMFSETQ